MSEQNQQLEALKDIRQMMQRSSRFISLSGLSGIAAGICGLAGSYVAYNLIKNYDQPYSKTTVRGGLSLNNLDMVLLFLAAGTLALALLLAFYFTWRKTKMDKVPLWNPTSKKLAINMMIPLAAGGFFVLVMLENGDWHYITPACLIFYGLALVNAGKYTLSDIRYLGIFEIVLGLISTQFRGYGLYFWAIGFGVLHIIYGFIMWWKNERKPAIA